MDYAQIAFLLFATVATLSAIAVISLRNPVHAALSLVLTFFSIACTWIVAGAEFLGVTLILVYVGAVMVLFLFVVMMLDIDVAAMRQGFRRHVPIGVIVALVMLAEIVTLIGVRAHLAEPFVDNAAVAVEGTPNTVWLARTLFTEFLLPFELASVILTVAVIAAVMLTLRPREGVRQQDPGAQSRVRPQDRLRMVRMEPVRRSSGDADSAKGGDA